MQEEVHKEMMSEGVAKKPNKQWYTKEWIVVDNEQEGIGLEIEYELIRTHRLMFVNEVGSNTSQAKDGNVGGEKFLSISGGQLQICASTKDDHFTVLGVTAANGKSSSLCNHLRLRSLGGRMGSWSGSICGMGRRRGIHERQ